MTELDTRLTSCFLTVFPKVDVATLPTLTRTNYDDWDSLASISLLTIVEEEFDVVFDDATVDNLSSFDAFRAATAKSIS